jgi:hypothetical protein
MPFITDILEKNYEAVGTKHFLFTNKAPSSFYILLLHHLNLLLFTKKDVIGRPCNGIYFGEIINAYLLIR